MFSRRHYKEQLDACFDWIREVATPEDVIKIQLRGSKVFFIFEFPLSSRDRPKRVMHSGAESQTTFFITTPTVRPPEGFLQVFTSPVLAVWENPEQIREFIPLRRGLSEFEKKLLLDIAREGLAKFLTTGRWPSLHTSARRAEIPSRLHRKSDVGVALWVDGRMRGSMIETGKHLLEGILSAAALASKDSRFPPVQADELPHTRIEITLIRPLKVPLREEEYRANEIYPTKGYVLTEKDHVGWYLPEMFNVRRFTTLKEFAQSLATEKAKLGVSPNAKRVIRTFDTEDFIESADETHRPLSLLGPAVSFGTVRFPLQESVLDRLTLAAQWLCGLQQENGSMPAILSPLFMYEKNDLLRQTFTLLALAEYHRTFPSPAIDRVLKRGAQYLARIEKQEPHTFLCEVYRGQLAIARGDREVAERIGAKFAELPLSKFEPITYAQLLVFFAKLNERGHPHVSELLSALERTFKEQRRKNASMNLAVWAEAALAFHFHSSPMKESVIEWILPYQNRDGSFPRDTHGGLPYTRGTGKIFEVLALWPDRYHDALGRALSWLLSMQYTEDSLFFVSPERRDRFLGGFRHDMLNADTWIDAAGHILLGAARLKKYGGRNS